VFIAGDPKHQSQVNNNGNFLFCSFTALVTLSQRKLTSV